MIKPSLRCDVSRVYTEGCRLNSLLLAAKQKSVSDYKLISSSSLASLIAVFEIRVTLCPLWLFCCSVLRTLVACSDVLLSASWLVGERVGRGPQRPSLCRVFVPSADCFNGFWGLFWSFVTKGPGPRPQVCRCRISERCFLWTRHAVRLLPKARQRVAV